MFLSKKEAWSSGWSQRGAGLRRLEEGGRAAGRELEGARPRVVWPWRRLSSPGGRKGRVGNRPTL